MARLACQVAAAAEAFARPRKCLAFLLFTNTRRDVVAYLGLLAAGHVPALIDPALGPEMLGHLKDVYCPEFVVGGAGESPGGPVAGRRRPSGPPGSLRHPTIPPFIPILACCSPPRAAPAVPRWCG